MVVEAEQVRGTVALFVKGEVEVVEGVFVGFEAEVFEAVGNAGVGRGRFAVFPVGGVDDFLDARFQDGVEVVAHLDEDVVAGDVVFADEGDDGVGGGASAGEVVDYFGINSCCNLNALFNGMNRFREVKDISFRKKRKQYPGPILGG